MIRSVFVGTLFFTAITLHAADISAIFASANKVNQDYSSIRLDLELATLRHQKSTIEAKDDLDGISAESTFLQAKATYRRSLVSYYQDVLDSAFGAVLADISLQIALGNEEVAREDEASAGQSVLKGLAPRRDLIDARTTTRSAAVDTEEARWGLSDARDELMNVTGLAISEIELPQSIKPLVVELTADQWIEWDFAVQRARVDERGAQLRFDRLPGNTADFDRTVAKGEFNRAALDSLRAVDSARAAYEGIVRKLQTQREIISMRTEVLELNRELAQDAAASYKNGMMSQADKKRTDVRVLTARKNLLQAELDYAKTIMEYVVVAGIEPEDAL